MICCKNGFGYWNRDVNGATNIYKIAYNVINNKERPKPKFIRSVKGFVPF